MFVKLPVFQLDAATFAISPSIDILNAGFLETQVLYKVR